MMQVIEQTPEEKLKMYMKCSKVELAKMLIECNRLLTAQMEVKNLSSNLPVIGSCHHQWYKDTTTTALQWKCALCGQPKLDGNYL
jgi:hypothetical protein